MLRLSTLPEWLCYIQTLQKKTIQLGLSRVQRVLQAIGVTRFPCPVITVAGTNGKGSTVRMLEAAYHRADYKVATFTSPALFAFNEMIRINETPLSDEGIIEAFQRITQIAGHEELTPFEFHTIAALLIFSECPLDVIVLEVGLGGRLDAVNTIDADVAVITSISLDHTEYLGNTREAIGREKAGILRAHKPAVIGDLDMPASIKEVATEVGAPLYRIGSAFSFERDQNEWHWYSTLSSLPHLPVPALLLQNVSCAMMVIALLNERLPVTTDVIRLTLQEVSLIGRQQVIEGPITQIVDVSHNPASIAMLAAFLHEHTISGKTLAVFSMLADKDIKACIDAIKGEIDEWWIAELQDKRATDLSTLSHLLENARVNFQRADSIQLAYASALQHAKEGDRVVVFGSFHTVREALIDPVSGYS